MAKGGGGPDSSPDAPGGGMGADAFGGGGVGSNDGPSLSMDGIATPAEVQALDDMDRAKAVRDAIDAISAAERDRQNREAAARGKGRLGFGYSPMGFRDSIGLMSYGPSLAETEAINAAQERDIARAKAVRDAQRNIALAQAKATEQAKRDIPTITLEYTPRFDYGSLRNPPFATRSPTKAGLFGPSFEETKAINEAKKSANRNRVKEYAKSYKARIDDIDKQLKSLLDKSMMNLFSKEYRELLDKKNNLMSHPNYNYVAHFDPSLRAAQTIIGTLAPGPLGIGPTLQDKAIDLGFIDDTPISEIENQDRQAVLEGDRGGNIFYDYTFSAK
jgi:hypothetical protein